MKPSWQALVYAFALSIALDLGLAYLLASWTSSDPAAFWAYAGLILLLPIPLALWSLVKRWIGWWAFGKEAAARHFLREFHQGGFPPTDGDFDILYYLDRVASDETMPVGSRIRSATVSSGIETAKALGGFSTGMMLTSAAEDALQRYKPKGQIDLSLDDDFYQ